MMSLIRKGVLLLILAIGTQLLWGQEYEYTSNDEFRSYIEYYLAPDSYFGPTYSLSVYNYDDMDVYGEFIEYIKTEIEPKELINSSGKKSTLEAVLLTGRQIYSELYSENEAESLNESYQSFLANYIAYLKTLGLGLDHQLVTQNLKKTALFDVIYYNSSFNTSEDPEEDAIYGGIGSYYDYPLDFLSTREVVINALMDQGFELTQSAYKSKKYMNFYEMRMIETFNNSDLYGNLDFLNYLLKQYPENTELFGGRTIFTVAMYEAEPPLLSPEFYEVMLRNGFDANLPCQVCSGLTPLIMLGNLPNVIPIYKTLSSKKYQKGKMGSAYSESFGSISTPYFQEGYFMAYVADRQVLAVAKVLMNNGAEVNFSQNDLGTTALHSAVSNAHVELVKYLLENGADKNIEDKNGNTPIDLITDMQGWVLPVDEELAERIDAIIELLD